MKLKTLLYCLLALTVLFVVQQGDTVCGEVAVPMSAGETAYLEASDGDKSSSQYVCPLQMHSSRVMTRLRRTSGSLQTLFVAGLPSVSNLYSSACERGRCIIKSATSTRKLALFCVRLI